MSIKRGMALAGVAGALLAGYAVPATAQAPPSTAGVAPPEFQRKAAEPDPKVLEAIKELKLETYVPLERLTQLNNGPGIVVCPPTLAKPDATVREFTEGMGRWLHLIVGGHGELGRTPLWTPMDRAWTRFRGRHNLTLDEAARLSQYLGITHVAVGEIAPEGEGYRLTYQVSAVPAKQPVGEPLVVTGSLEEIRAAMPRLAASIARTLGVAMPRVPAAVGETVEELRLLGRIPWIPGPRIMGEPLDQLRAMAVAAHSPSAPGARPHPPLLGAFLYFINRGALRRGQEVNELAPLLPRAFPDNAIVFGEIGRQAHWAARWEPAVLPQERLTQLLGRFPDNYLLRTAESYFHRVRADRSAARLAAQHATAASMRSTDAWIHLDDIITEQAEMIRRARYVQDLSPEELKVTRAIYAEELKAAQESVRLDPEYGIGWRHVSTSAGFLGDGKLAEEALWKSIELRPDRQTGLQFGPDPEDFRTFWWGLEMFQEKWYNDAAKLDKVAQLVTERAVRWSPEERVLAAISLFHAGRLETARGLLRDGEEVEGLEAHIKLHKEQDQKQ